MQRSDRVLAIAGLSTLFLLLVGVLAYTMLARPQGSSTAPFELQATNGETVDRSTFAGQASLLYFGYTHCPEVCPTTLFDMAGWLEQLGPEGEDLQAFFVTVDPERDTLAVVEPYVAAFSDRIVGVTGDPAEIAKAADAWVAGVGIDRRADGQYSMRHQASVLMVGPDGRLVGLIPYEATPEQATDRIRSLLL